METRVISSSTSSFTLPDDFHEHILSSEKLLQQIEENHTKRQFVIQSLRLELDLHREEIKKNVAQHASIMHSIAAETRKNFAGSSLQGDLTVPPGDENLKLVEEQKKELEDLRSKMEELQKQLEVKQFVELKLNSLRARYAALEEMKLKEAELLAKKEEIEDAITFNQTVKAEGQMLIDELQDARDELIIGLKKMPTKGRIGSKRVGELDSASFLEACRLKFPAEVSDVKAAELCSLWEANIEDPRWHPYKIIRLGQEDKLAIDEEDDKLRKLRSMWGEEVHRAVARTISERIEYNPIGWLPVNELRNYKEHRRATLAEGLEYIFSKWKSDKR